MVYTGIVSNLSKNGMCIETRKDFPLKSELEILVLMSGEALKVPVTVTVSRLIENGHMFYGLGTELIEQPSNYIQFVDRAHYPLSEGTYPFVTSMNSN